MNELRTRASNKVTVKLSVEEEELKALQAEQEKVGYNLIITIGLFYK